MQALVLRAKLLELWRSSQGTTGVLLDGLGRSASLVFVAYILASMVSSVTVRFISGSAMQHRMLVKQEPDRIRLGKETNYRDMRKVIVERNMFNSAGILPDEPDPSVGGASNAFNPADKCQKPTVNVELLGIIHTGQADTTFATILEKGYTIADVYRAGDRIVGQDQALIYAIEESAVILNNNGVKECLELNSLMGANKAALTGSNAASGGMAMPMPSAEDANGADCPGGTVSFDSQTVEEALGPGFAKILEAGRLVPHHRDNAMIGFKLIGVRGGSLWTRANLASGDVITAVNGTSMAQPEKGFAVYEALQSEKQIRVDYLKGGKSPCSLNISIK